MIVALITVLITSILAISAFNTTTVVVGSAYAIHENGLQHGFVPRGEFDGGEQESPIESIPPDEAVSVQEPVLPEAVPQQSPLNELGEPMGSLHYQVGEIHGMVLGSDTGTVSGLYARDSGLEANHTNSYQQPNDHSICRVLQDFYGTISLGDEEAFTSLSECLPGVSQQQQNDYFQGFRDGYAAAFPLGFYTGYWLDEHSPGSVQSPTQQSPTQQSPTQQSPTQQSPTQQSPTQQSPGQLLPPIEEVFPGQTPPP